MLVPTLDDNIWGCDPLVNEKREEGEIFVWLFKRGNCSFQKKASNGQQSGAFAVLTYQNDNSDINFTLPVADSFYNDLQIPLLLISKKSGEMIAEEIKTSKEVLLSFNIELVK